MNVSTSGIDKEPNEYINIVQIQLFKGISIAQHMCELFSQLCSLLNFEHHSVKTQDLFCWWASIGGAGWDVTFYCGLTSLLTEVFHSVPAVAAWADIIREVQSIKGSVLAIDQWCL